MILAKPCRSAYGTPFRARRSYFANTRKNMHAGFLLSPPQSRQNNANNDISAGHFSHRHHVVYYADLMLN